MAAGAAVEIVGSDASRVLLVVRYVGGTNFAEIGWQSDLDNQPAYVLGSIAAQAGGGVKTFYERIYDYGTYGALMQGALYGRIGNAGDTATVQWQTVSFSTAFANDCKRKQLDESVGAPAAAHPDYWYDGSRVTLT